MTTTYTYFLHGAPRGELRTVPGQPDKPAPVLSIERRTQAGMVDLYLLTSRSDTFGTANYKWHSGGTPEEVMATFAELAHAWEAQQR
jgi:hypothetical protein